MSAVIILGVLAGVGCAGVIAGASRRVPSLDAVAHSLNQPVDVASRIPPSGMGQVLGAALATRVQGTMIVNHPRWPTFTSALTVTGESAERLASKVVVASGIGLLGPFMGWIVLEAMGADVPLLVTVVLSLVCLPLAATLPLVSLFGRARDRRRHFRIVIGSFVDLVVLGLAGGVGVEGALFTASSVSSDWAAQWMNRVLLTARESGMSPWVALSDLGRLIAVDELVDLTATLQLAGTEGARIRQALTARAVSLRRHEQADQESEANAVTERLFLPGALLLVGFLLFVGYPAFSRIIGGI